MINVIKRNGTIDVFTLSKVKAVLIKAFNACFAYYNQEVIDTLSLKVVARMQAKIKDSTISVEDIQDCVEDALAESGFCEIARAYTLYRADRAKAREKRNAIIDCDSVINKYLNAENWRVKENSTVNYSIGGLILSNSGTVTANYWLSDIYDNEVAAAHRSGDIHLHDLSMLSGYCAGWSLKQLIKEGICGVPGKITSAPLRSVYLVN